MQDGMLGVGKPARESPRKTPTEIARLCGVERTRPVDHVRLCQAVAARAGLPLPN